MLLLLLLLYLSKKCVRLKTPFARLWIKSMCRNKTHFTLCNPSVDLDAVDDDAEADEDEEIEAPFCFNFTFLSLFLSQHYRRKSVQPTSCSLTHSLTHFTHSLTHSRSSELSSLSLSSSDLHRVLVVAHLEINCAAKHL